MITDTLLSTSNLPSPVHAACSVAPSLLAVSVSPYLISSFNPRASAGVRHGTRLFVPSYRYQYRAGADTDTDTVPLVISSPSWLAHLRPALLCFDPPFPPLQATWSILPLPFPQTIAKMQIPSPVDIIQCSDCGGRHPPLVPGPLPLPYGNICTSMYSYALRLTAYLSIPVHTHACSGVEMQDAPGLPVQLLLSLPVSGRSPSSALLSSPMRSAGLLG